MSLIDQLRAARLLLSNKPDGTFRAICPGCDASTIAGTNGHDPEGDWLSFECENGCEPETVLELVGRHVDARIAANEAYWSSEAHQPATIPLPDWATPESENGHYAHDRWLDGEPCDPFAEPPEPLPTCPGIPFAYPSSSVLISAPTGSGKSSLLEAAMYDAAKSGMRCAYMSGEVGQGEFNARVRDIAERRGDDLKDDELRERLARSLRWLDLPPVMARAWRDPESWADEAARLYDVFGIDPVSSVASSLALDFDKSNQEYVKYHDTLIKPLTDRGLVVIQVDNVGHAIEAKGRAKGVSAKQDKTDIVLSCSLRAGPALAVRAVKVRSVRSPFKRGDEWTFDRETQRITAGAPTEDGPGETFRPTGIMEKVSRALEADPGLTGNGVRAAIRHRAKFVDLALSLLIAEEFVTVKPEGQAKRHYSAKPYRVPASEPRPDHVPDAVSEPRPHVPALKGRGTWDAGHGHRTEPTASRRNRPRRTAARRPHRPHRE